MENASKALIIAGAVLIAILLISLTLIIIKNANPVIKQTEQVGATIEVHTFNSQFLPYTGDPVRGSQVRNLCDVVIANNGNSKNQKVKLNDKGDSDDIITIKNGIKLNKTYEVKETYATSGYIENISITAK